MKPYPLKDIQPPASAYTPADMARLRGQLGSADATPPEAGNISLPSADDDIAGWWPVTGREVFVFWAIAMAAVLSVVLIAIFAPGYLAGCSTAEIIKAVITWGL